jgi:hypothetical protein
LRRMMVIAAAIAALGVMAATALADALNTYTAKVTLTSKKAGTASKPVPIGYTQNLTAAGNNGNRTAVLLNITTKIYGLTEDGKDFPTCSLNKIATAKSDTVCPKGAKVARGSITAVLGNKNDFSPAGGPPATCDPNLDVWNSGQGKLTFFFVDTPSHQCLSGALSTGDVGPYPATVKRKGKNLVVDVPIPTYVDFPSGLAGSLESEHLVWLKHTTNVKGKTVASIASTGCSKGKRPYSTTFTSTLPTSGAKAVSTLTGSAPC